MKVVGNKRTTDWPKLGPSLLIAATLTVAIRTARWAAQRSPDPHLANTDTDLDREVDYALRIVDRVLYALLRKHHGMFPEKLQAIYEVEEDSEDVAK